MRKLEQKEWWPELVAKKDAYSLRELAEMFGATPGAINTALKRNGITRSPAPSGPRAARKTTSAPKKAAPKKAAPKKTAPKKAAAKKAAPKKAAPKKAAPKKAAPKKAAPKKVEAPKAAKTRAKPGPKPGPRKSTLAKLAPFKDQLGKVADGEIASLAGVSNATVASYRKSLGIAATRKRGPSKAKVAKAAAKPAPKKRRSKIAPFEHLLGKETDAVVAKAAGVSTNAVTNYRNRLGIAPSRKRRAAAPKVTAPKAAAPKAAAPKAAPKKAAPAKAAPKAAPKKAAPAKAASASLAFRVQLGSSTAIVVAGDLVEAAAKAVASGKKVTSIELLGPILA